jgi:hypothetical protein
MNTNTADKEITFSLFYRKARKPGMISIEEATAQVERLSREEGWEFKTYNMDRFGRWVLTSARKPAFGWEAVANRAGIAL